MISRKSLPNELFLTIVQKIKIHVKVNTMKDIPMAESHTSLLFSHDALQNLGQIAQVRLKSNSITARRVEFRMRKPVRQVQQLSEDAGWSPADFGGTPKASAD